MELETSRITNEIRAYSLTIPEEEMGFRGHRPMDSYADKCNVGHVVELEKGSSGNAVMLKTGVNAGDLCSVEDSVTGDLGLSSGLAVDLKDDCFDLRKLRSNWCLREKSLLENGSVDCLMYSDEDGEFDAASFVETVEDLLPSRMNDELEA
ncbi:hypothetical protein AVEN_162552-1 [Araneus ventricosus]|uniref:Uncharacterized protein n=1 Tax=Araneus ventricosus TaxID=182803 RepID=A0A4Y2KTE2_ARAVE|nr:hypothetical protein AVEN_162552-1 [Araneus ventricosus]